MARVVYDGEDRYVARNLYAHPKRHPLLRVVEIMRANDPERYGTLQYETLLKWKKKDKGTEFDWDRRRRELRRKQQKRQDEQAELIAEDVLSRMLDDMLRLRDLISERIEEQTVKDGRDISQTLFAYMKCADRVLELLREVTKEVDLTRLTRESQVFFIRRMLEDIREDARGIDEELSRLWEKYEDAILNRFRSRYKDEVINDVKSDLCLDAIIERKKELDARRDSQTDAGQGGTLGVHGDGR